LADRKIKRKYVKITRGWSKIDYPLLSFFNIFIIIFKSRGGGGGLAR